MLRFARTAVTLAGIAFLALFAGCTLGGPPTSVSIAADTDTTVLVTWSVPAEGTADAYLVYFQPVRETGYTLLADITGLSYTHNPHGVTGTYKVAAEFAGTVYDSKDSTLSTIPVHTDTLGIYELNADSSQSGYGWDTLSGEGSVFSMAVAANAATVDLYASDLRPGHGVLPYVDAQEDDTVYLVSPNVARTKDSGAIGIVPSANWRTNALHEPVGAGFEHEPVPAYDSLPVNYYDFMELAQQPTLVPVYTNLNKLEDRRHFALVKVQSVDTLTGRVVVESWYQRVPRLRLMKH